MKFPVEQRDIDLGLVLVEHGTLEIIVSLVIRVIGIALLVSVISDVQELAHEVELDFIFTLGMP
jgi:hypothetical protein